MEVKAAVREAIESADVSSVAVDDAERTRAFELLEMVVARGLVSRADIVKSLTVPPGEEYVETTLLRFLRARKGNLELSATMIEAAVALRKKYDIDNILHKPLAKPILEHIRKGCWDGILPEFDKSGRPIYILQGGKANKATASLLTPPPGFTQANWSWETLEDQWLHWHLIWLEYLRCHVFPRATAKAGKLINKYTIMDDLKGFNLTGAKNLYRIMPVFKKIAVIDSLLYPECMAIFFFINTPKIFSGAWAIIKGFLDKDTAKKIHILGGPSTYQPALDVLFEPSVLPEFVGGTLQGNHCTNYDQPFCQTYSQCDKFCVENSFAPDYAEKRSTPFQVLSIKAGADESVFFQASQGDTVDFQVAIASHDIEYSLLVGDDVLRKEMVKSSEQPLSTCHAIDRDCNLEFKFSNSHSRFTSKKVFFRVFSYRKPTQPKDATSNGQDAVSPPLAPVAAQPSIAAEPCVDVTSAGEDGAAQPGADITSAGEDNLKK